MKRRVVSTRKYKKKTGSRAYEAGGLLLTLLGILSCLSLAGQSMGLFGDLLRQVFQILFGKGAIIPAFFCILQGLQFIGKGPKVRFTWRFVAISLLYWMILAGIHAWIVPMGQEFSGDMILAGGGALGAIAVYGLHALFGTAGLWIVLIAGFILDIVFLTHFSLSPGVNYVEQKTAKHVARMGEAIKEKKAIYDEQRRVERELGKSYSMTDFIFHKRHLEDDQDAESEKTQLQPMGTVESDMENQLDSQAVENNGPEPILNTEPEENLDIPEEEEIAVAPEPESGPIPEEPDMPAEVVPPENAATDKPEGSMKGENPVSPYKFPPLTLLKPGGRQSASLSREAEEKKKILESTLHNFGVAARVINTSVGPTVTRFELEPAPGVKVKKIENLADDIALQLAATHIRIEAPIPGKSAVGIEVPNGKTTMVALRDVLDSDEFRNAHGNVNVALGKDITGKTIVADLTRMPHLLIAGSTGSGKSVCINTIIMSILYHYRPEEVKMLLIDPKVVELSVYNAVPHLRSPVVTEPKKAAGALQWAVKEMEHRYKLFSASAVRDIRGYNRLNPKEKMPYLIIIIDELADLMMVAADSVEQAICRLAQKARAAGIHLVLATQRPSVDVITGLIKANIPSRISFAVSSQIDSRTILDKAGAENLLGKGDMLFDPIGAQNPVRVQGAFVSDSEVESVTSYIHNETAVKEMLSSEEPLVFTAPDEAEKAAVEEEQDELFPEAVEWILDTGRASVSMLQRRFRIGYTRAGRLMDTMEEMGIVGPANGAKPREILMNKEQADKLLSGNVNKEVNHG